MQVEIVSAHRTPEKMMEYGKNARIRGLKVIIAGAGGAAHLPGMVASLTTLPVVLEYRLSHIIQFKDGTPSCLSYKCLVGSL